MALSLRRRPSRFAASRRGLQTLTQPAPVSPNVLPTPETAAVPSIAQPFNAPEKSTLTQGSSGTPPQAGWKFVGNYQNPGGDKAEIWHDPTTGLNHMTFNGQDVIPPYPGNAGNAGTTAPVQAPPGPGLPGYVGPGAAAPAAAGNGVTRVTPTNPYVNQSVTAPPEGVAVPAAGWGGQNNPTNPYAGTNMNYGGSSTVADTAMIGGVKVWAGGPWSGKPVADHPDGGDLTPYLKDPTLAAPAGSGGPAPAAVQIQLRPVQPV